jgi:hypothetical protein
MSRVIHTRSCEKCGKTFHPKTAEINRGRGRFCSPECGRYVKPRRSLEDRFFDGIGQKQPNGCIPWAKSVRNGWHGQIGKGGHACGMLVASRVAYDLMVGHIPDGMHVLHRCDNPRCVNPTHLFLGTQTDNMADKTAKGRQRKGEQCYQAKLTADAVREIRARAAAGEGQESISREFKVSKATVCMVVKRKRWAHVA